ncbi:MAG TPA: YigZ family protein [Crenotrichaceae bacterium]|nr:YigZ family protein [Crenotrichaceae bacterium]
MNCIQGAQSTDYLVKKSRFIGFAIPCTSETEVMTILHAIHVEHSNANHLAFAFKVLDSGQMITRFNDAGEPKGTAGKPILAHLEGKDLVNIVIAVIRYFGGIKLGAGGLVRAYGTTAKNVLECCTFIPYQAMVTVDLQVDYKKLNEIQRQLQVLDGRIISQDFGAQIELTIQLPENNVDLLKSHL